MMKSLKITSLFACTIVTMVGRLDNSTGPETIIDPSARSYYYIANQNGLDLNVTYKIAFLPMDSTVAVPPDSTTQIFESGGFSYSSPSKSFDKLSFYSSSGDTTSPILAIQPIVDENWNDVTAEDDTVRKYELIITNEDIKITPLNNWLRPALQTDAPRPTTPRLRRAASGGFGF